MELLKMKSLDEAYPLLQEAFPISELRPYVYIEEKMKTSFVELLGAYEDQQLVGVFLLWQLQDCIFVENFAVAKHTRGMGIGSKMLDALKEKYLHTTLILEVEEPFDHTSARRVAFYKRNQFQIHESTYLQPQINTEKNIHPLCFMSYPKPLDDDLYQKIQQEVFTKVYEVKM
ncbi:MULTISPECIES: GNAT family N-acetyltransferase [unclassified Breznakia]|uniref:GNAT family N-acetyltransferase n=1 Tax=unclassified Breznakia TaxID=2623764 RepID=UPI0024765522|nr:MULTISPECIES: GNAT family N-acetyltransferase [unclassified Breznakia]MDH6367086.1 ribosomal protein S18 acetylase RimI-like enzyme [Breznakia sp. PH1-1]MDH6404327.1 ribosomal protein S18 acetylase RimI-like enzyme [Breznakia sp. PF1-11]MDH6411973.1 ribosomal protein S18 acetylase RimI-like enzyme [Breznakia sp. PFB1-11]MDH6414315.1 ribosomal protein S18 acetylase RimI-like enzyme [Breznakia sp. PFB1-14]MDH6416587.1 ribosomal protein S18 acetylase RimI-like enzyme [Breznakia sp. PFB1-4]